MFTFLFEMIFFIILFALGANIWEDLKNLSKRIGPAMDALKLQQDYLSQVVRDSQLQVCEFLGSRIPEIPVKELPIVPR